MAKYKKSPSRKKTTLSAPAGLPTLPANSKKAIVQKKHRAKKPIPLDTKAKVMRYVRTKRFATLFAWGSVAVLAATTLFWTILAARLHQLNADQLIDGYLFEDLRTFQGAVFPGAHSFLLKWPVFAVVSMFGNSMTAFMLATIAMVFAAVGTLVYVLYRIEKRPVVFGLLCLSLSSVLPLVPAEPSPGALLPVNMAMMTTRNLEYAVYIVALYLALRSRKLRSYSFAAAAVLMALLIASDKLFAVIGIGGGVVASAWYALRFRRRAIVSPELRWLVIAMVGSILATVLLLAIDRVSITRIGGGDTASPYPLIHTLNQFIVGCVYAVTGLATNFGANAVYGTHIIRDIPSAVLHSLSHVTTFAYTVNLTILLGGIYASARIVMRRSAGSNDSTGRVDIWTRLALLLLGSTVAAIGVYVVTDHYYPVDARYLTIGLFAVCIASAVFLRGYQLRGSHAACTVAVLLLAIPIGLYASWSEYRSDVAALARKDHVANRVSEELQRHGVHRLVGDYWDVTPIKAKAANPLTIMPVDSCTMPRQVLNSDAWFDRQDRTSAAYLAVKDVAPNAMATTNRAPTYNGCSLAHVVGEYGVPSERVAITKSDDGAVQDAPDVLLLFYPDGIRSPTFQSSSRRSHTHPGKTNKFAPGPPEVKSFVSFADKDICSHGTTLQVVAHQDDDLLFMNPDIYNSVKDGVCIRTVYLTAGDAGETLKYWGGRERGAKAAYAQMYDKPNVWHEELQMLAGHQIVVNYLESVPQVSLVFLRLPDGNLGGEGFSGHDHESLHILMEGAMSAIHSVDSANTYTKNQIVEVLNKIMAEDLPQQIRTQGSDDTADGDHADHHDAGILTAEAAASYLQPHEMARYLGYPDKGLPINLSDDDITTKQSIFLAYAKFDGAVCQTAFECQNTFTYGNYLLRQYQQAAP